MKKSSKLHKPKQQRKKRKAKAQSTPKKVEEFVHFKAKPNSEGIVNIKFGENGEVTSSEAIQGSINSYRGRMRESGKEKRVVRSYTKNGTAYISQRDNIRHNYDALAAIDTNNFEIDGRRLSIASSFYSGSINTDNVEFFLLPAFVISDVNTDLNPEVVGWHLFFKHVFTLLKIPSNCKLGLIVDSELDKHIAMNNGDEAYYKDHYLPNNVGLIYAFDKGADLQNKIIRKCDRFSRALFKKIESGELVLPSQLGAGTNDYSGYAYVNYDTATYKIV